MPKPGKFTICENTLQIGAACIPVGSSEWFGWLSQQTRFSFQGKNGHFSAQCEIRSEKPFWYAYRRRAGKLYKQYLGKSEELTPERLEHGCIALAGKTLLDQFANQPGSEAPLPVESRIDTSFLPMAKVNMPVPPLHLFPRPRLTNRINTPLTLIHAPSGFGKSTLINDWKQTCHHPVAWVALDESDNLPQHFWSSVLMALQAIQPDFGRDLLTPLRSAAPNQLPELITRLTDEIVHNPAFSPHLGLVLDNFERIHQSDINNSLQAWLGVLPPALNLVIMGHTKPPLALGPLRAPEFLTELEANDLRFTLDESIRYLQQGQQGTPLAHTDLEKLARHTEGWAAGLTLTAQALDKQEDPRQFIDSFSGAHIYMREYFLETVLKPSRPDVQEFLLKTAILKHLTGSLCDAVTAHTGSEQMLSTLWNENVFIVRLEAQSAYRYHDLFAEMLLSQLQARYPADIPHLHQRAAEWYRQQQAPADAIYHLLLIEAWEEAASLMEILALRELEQYGEDSRLLRWLQELPENVVQKHKTLLFVYLRLADMALPKQKIEHFIRQVEINLASTSAHIPSPDEREVLLEIQRLRYSWEQGTAFSLSSQDTGENVARWELLNGLQLLKQGSVTDPLVYEHQLSSLLQKAQTQHNLFVVLMVGGELARRVFANGQFRRSEKIARQVLEQVLAERGTLPEPASISLAILSQICLERNELERAGKYLDQALEVDPNPTSSNMLVQIGIQRSTILAAQGKFDQALANTHAIRALHIRRPSRRWTDQDLCAAQAWICLRQGQISAAETLMRAAQGKADHYFSSLVLAGILLEKKQAAEAETILTSLLAQYPGGTNFEPVTPARVMLALAFFEQRKINQALQTMSEAIRLATPERFYRPFLEHSPKCQPLLRLALHGDRLGSEAHHFVSEVLRLSGNEPDQDCLSAESLQALITCASISPREQEVLQLLNNGCSNLEIAQHCCLSESTVKTHLGHLYTKLTVNSRTKAVKRARELELVR